MLETAAEHPAVRFVGIHKRFGAVAANVDVSFAVAAGSIHGLVGENGAGKSTLMSILYGFYPADSGHVEVMGQRARIRHADDAMALGLGMVHQHFMLVDTLSVLDNILLGAEGHWRLGQAQAQARPRLLELMAATGLHLDLDRSVADLPVGERQRLEILKVLFRGARILILDEPTAVLTPQETQQLFDVLRRLRDQGTTVILITHKLKEVMAVCSAVTVMRCGRWVADFAVAETRLEDLAAAMVGRKVNLGRAADDIAQPGAVALEARDLTVIDAWGVARLRGVSLQLRAGEIVGVAGVSGNGQSELLDVLSGMQQPQSGRITLGAEVFEPGRGLTPTAARALGVAHVPEDRLARGLVLSFPAWESAVLGYEDDARYQRWGWMRRGAMRAQTQTMMQEFDVRPPNPDWRSRSFSGGNQQKLVLARELGRQPKVLLVGQPTRGVDIGAIEFIHAQLRRLRQQGCAVLVVSTELDEILALADRVLVMNQGRITGDLPLQQCSESALGLLMGADAS